MKTTYTLRLPEELGEKVRQEAGRSAMSINQYILYTLTKDISYKEAAASLKKRIQDAPSRKEALRLLESLVPDVPSLKGDTILKKNNSVCD